MSTVTIVTSLSLILCQARLMMRETPPPSNAPTVWKCLSGMRRSGNAGRVARSLLGRSGGLDAARRVIVLFRSEKPRQALSISLRHGYLAGCLSASRVAAPEQQIKEPVRWIHKPLPRCPISCATGALASCSTSRRCQAPAWSGIWARTPTVSPIFSPRQA